MIIIDDFITDFSKRLKAFEGSRPWEITDQLKDLLEELIPTLGTDYRIEDGVAIHKTATIETGVMIKRPAIIEENCFVGAHAYFREGVYLDQDVKIGPGCELKTSIICSNTAIAHFNYIGNSIIGRNVNFEAGSIAANHYNERVDKRISILHNGEIIETNSNKFGSLVGDDSKIGANAVLSPGTILNRSSIVKRLELIEQFIIEK
ncbi:DapH/DapD/GlmU-related protein [Fluviicola sp.]|uniref:DapH/DapD/GlmU-related protein n=1 Tax=Fluviicola sp. TaxID=1917219 RepID=UPI003D29B571